MAAAHALPDVEETGDKDFILYIEPDQIRTVPEADYELDGHRLASLTSHLIEQYRPDLAEQVLLDPETDTLVISSTTRTAVEEVRHLLGDYLSDSSALHTLITDNPRILDLAE